VLDDTADKLQGLVAIVFFRRDQRLIQDQADQVQCRRRLKFGDEVASRFKSGLALRFISNISRL
jgi:hypothetical protein